MTRTKHLKPKRFGYITCSDTATYLINFSIGGDTGKRLGMSGDWRRICSVRYGKSQQPIHVKRNRLLLAHKPYANLKMPLLTLNSLAQRVY